MGKHSTRITANDSTINTNVLNDHTWTGHTTWSAARLCKLPEERVTVSSQSQGRRQDGKSALREVGFEYRLEEWFQHHIYFSRNIFMCKQ